MLSAMSEVDYLVVDLKRVLAADRASILVLSELCRRTAEEGRRLFFTDCQHLYLFKKHLRALPGPHQEPGWLHFEDTDHALEWCEDRLIDAADLASRAEPCATELCDQYLCSGMTEVELEDLRRTATERRFPAGARIVRAGDPAESLYFILSGQVDVLVDTDAGHQLRLTTLGAGTVFGEVALVNRKRRTADVVAATDAFCLEVRFDALADTVRNKMLVNMASYFAGKIEQDTELMQHLG